MERNITRCGYIKELLEIFYEKIALLEREGWILT